MEKSFIEKLTSVQRDLRAPKSKFNNFGKFKYRSCEDILEAVKPLLIEQGLLLTISDSIEAFGDKIYVKATATITDGITSIANAALARDPITKSGMDGAQVTGASSSYARKYALNGLFLIDDMIDADGMDISEPKKKSTTKVEQVAPVSREELIEKAKALGIDFSVLIKYYKHDTLEELTDKELTDAIAKKERKRGSK